MTVTDVAALGLSTNQLRNARGIIAAVQERGWPPKAAVIAVETALVESGMRILASANVPASQQYPHDLLGWTYDGMGHDHASCGMFQQQTGYRWTPAGYAPPEAASMQQTTMNSPDGWGTPAELMDPEISTGKFLDALAHVDWRSMSNWTAAQAVQHSAFRDGSNYRSQDSRAGAIVAALWTEITDLLEEIMSLYDPTRKLTPAEKATRENFERAIQRVVFRGVRPFFLDDSEQKSRPLRWHLRRLIPGARSSDGTGK